jgi:hypothetical protein
MNRAETQQILDLVAEYDQRETSGDMIATWHHQIGHLDKTTAEEAVAIHHKVNTHAIMPKDVIDLAEQIGTRTSTQHPMRRASMAAYQTAGALNYDCPRCGEPAGDPCKNPVTGQEAHAPCLARITGKTVAA